MQSQKTAIPNEVKDFFSNYLTQESSCLPSSTNIVGKLADAIINITIDNDNVYIRIHTDKMFVYSWNALVFNDKMLDRLSVSSCQFEGLPENVKNSFKGLDVKYLKGVEWYTLRSNKCANVFNMVGTLKELSFIIDGSDNFAIYSYESDKFTEIDCKTGNVISLKQFAIQGNHFGRMTYFSFNDKVYINTKSRILSSIAGFFNGVTHIDAGTNYGNKFFIEHFQYFYPDIPGDYAANKSIFYNAHNNNELLAKVIEVFKWTWLPLFVGIALLNHTVAAYIVGLLLLAVYLPVVIKHVFITALSVMFFHY